ncbi:MAG: NAD(P)/FAD-dependent oxidoreductase [Turneriella sp.]|nr:NAD(P)/FAD-dependent oxidoreductase [Turneriella sp.]
MDFDCAVIGAGVVGLACARELALKGLSVVVIERHARNGQEISSRNSCVIHAGMYYPEGSIKAELCFRANQRLYQYCEEKKIPHRKIGKFIVAVNSSEEEALEKIYARGIANGVEGLSLVSGKTVMEKNPAVVASCAIHSRETGIVDPHGLMDALEHDAAEHGAVLAYAHELVAVEKKEGYRLALRCGRELQSIETAGVVNAAGLDADRVAELAGIDVAKSGYTLHYCRGHYFSLPRKKSQLFHNLIYPVPPKTMAGLGVHITLDLDGNARLGPDTEYLSERRQDYTVSESLREKFFEAARWYIPSLEPDDLSPDYAGIRPKLQGPNDPYRDFVIAEESAKGLPGWVNLIGIESPGLTCALLIAERVAGYFR